MTDHLLIDTNLIVRYLVGDHEQHAKAATKIIEACDREEITLIVLPAVLSECVFVLESFYKHPRSQIATVLKAVIGSPGVELVDDAVHVDALDRYAATKLHFVDCTLAAYASSQGTRVASFDQEFKKFRDVIHFNPARDRL